MTHFCMLRLLLWIAPEKRIVCLGFFVGSMYNEVLDKVQTTKALSLASGVTAIVILVQR